VPNTSMTDATRRARPGDRGRLARPPHVGTIKTSTRQRSICRGGPMASGHMCGRRQPWGR
jgi:hypothetical protein